MSRYSSCDSTRDSIEILPITGSIGAEVEGVDLAHEPTDEQFGQIENALHQHLVLFFRDQHFDPTSQVAFSHRFGPPSPTPFIGTLPEHPEVIEVRKEGDEKSRFVFGGGWHSDFSFLERPPYVTCLYAREVPDFGGDTLWANMILAYESLPEEMRTKLDGLEVLHSGERAYSSKMQALQDLLENMVVANTDEALEVTTHPLVREHPVTGRRGLFISPVYSIGIKGMPDAEAQDLLAELNRHALSEVFTCRFRWRKGSVALWDNRFTQHYALNDYPGKRRLMHRTTAMGEVPLAAGHA